MVRWALFPWVMVRSRLTRVCNFSIFPPYACRGRLCFISAGHDSGQSPASAPWLVFLFVVPMPARPASTSRRGSRRVRMFSMASPSAESGPYERICRTRLFHSGPFAKQSPTTNPSSNLTKRVSPQIRRIGEVEFLRGLRGSFGPKDTTKWQRARLLPGESQTGAMRAAILSAGRWRR